MKIVFYKYLVLIFLFCFIGCKNSDQQDKKNASLNSNSIRYSKGFSLEKHDDYSILKILKPWPNSTKTFTFILHKKNVQIPDSLKSFPSIQIPIQRLIVTSTTHISSLEMLNIENTLIGFPGLDYISSNKIRARIDLKKIAEIGQEQNLNTEKILELNPDLVVGYGINNNNQTYDNLEKSGLKVIYNGDWNEQTPLGKAEWIKFFGALYNLDKKAESIFNKIETDYKIVVQLAQNAKLAPTILCGEMYENIWYLPEGNSWSSIFLRNANCDYLWKNTKGTGSLSLPFETVLDKAKNADFWFQGSFSSYKEMQDSNKHYAEFNAFKNKNIYSFSSKKGKTGGVIFYELSGNRPDLVLKDLVKILHPELLPDYELAFYSKLK